MNQENQKDEVAFALAAMETRRTRRITKFGVAQWSDESYEAELLLLRNVMFSRKAPEQAFQPLHQLELALLEHQVEQRINEKKLILIPHDSTACATAFHTIRHNHISGKTSISPQEFHRASHAITELLLRHICNELGIKPKNATVACVWRAGLAFVDSAHTQGFHSFAHLGAKRNEETLATELYFEEFPSSSFLRDRTIIIADPMLATGNTVITTIQRLQKLSVEQKNIVVVSVISAPEGVDHVLSSYPGVCIVSGAHDEHLNERGYIVPGLGDYGDQWREGVADNGDPHVWFARGILGENSYKALLAKMHETQVA